MDLAELAAQDTDYLLRTEDPRWTWARAYLSGRGKTMRTCVRPNADRTGLEMVWEIGRLLELTA
jgi:hypothetical protein